jgi:hypothetical protein
MTSRNRRAWQGSRTTAAFVAAVVGAALGACSSSPSSNGGTRVTTTSSGPVTAKPPAHALASLPMKGQASSMYPRLLVGSGSGNKRLGTVTVNRSRVFVQTVCEGPGSLTLVKLFAQGPCNNQTGVTSFAAPANGKVTFVVRADRATKWAVFVSQPA